MRLSAISRRNKNPMVFFLLGIILSGSYLVFGIFGTNYVSAENADIFCGKSADNFDRLITGTTGNDYLNGTQGNDLLRGFGGADSIDGKGGQDCIIGNGGDDFLFGGPGDDIIYGGEDDDHIYGNNGNDTLYGNSGNDLISGGSGNDYVAGKLGNDSIFGNDGNDKLFGNEGNDFVKGGDGADQMFGGDGDDIVLGNAGSDRQSGQDGDDDISGDRGPDNLNGGQGIDIINGGQDTDVCFDVDADGTITECENLNNGVTEDTSDKLATQVEPNTQALVSLSGDSRDAIYSKVVAQDDGNVYVVWMEDTGSGSPYSNYAFSSYDIMFRASNDSGNSFGPKINLSDDSWPTLPPVIAASGNHVFVVWSETEPYVNTEHLFFRASHDAGLTFDDKKELTRSGESAYRFRMASSEDGSIYVVWESSSGGGSAVFSASHDHGTTFSKPVTIFNPECSLSGTLDIAAPPKESNEVYVSVGGSCAEEGGNEVLFAASHDGGKTFDPLRMGLGQFLKVSAPGSGNVYASWQDQFGSVVFAASHDGGASFGDSIKLADGKDVSNAEPKMVAWGDNVYLIWHANVIRQLTPEEVANRGLSNQTTESDINTVLFFRSSTDKGDTFGPTVQLTSFAEYAYWPEIAAKDGTVAIVWSNVSSTASAGCQIFLVDSNDDGTTFNERTTIDKDTGDLLCFVQPGVAVGENSEYVTWWSGSFPDSFEVYLSRKSI